MTHFNSFWSKLSIKADDLEDLLQAVRPYDKIYVYKYLKEHPESGSYYMQIIAGIDDIDTRETILICRKDSTVWRRVGMTNSDWRNNLRVTSIRVDEF